MKVENLQKGNKKIKYVSNSKAGFEEDKMTKSEKFTLIEGILVLEEKRGNEKNGVTS
ncbi:hypothetical protein ACXM0N_19580 [Peribacillus simplex]